jgi:hypothetical protein
MVSPRNYFLVSAQLESPLQNSNEQRILSTAVAASPRNYFLVRGSSRSAVCSVAWQQLLLCAYQQRLRRQSLCNVLIDRRLKRALWRLAVQSSGYSTAAS